MSRIQTDAYVVEKVGAPFKLERIELAELRAGELLVKMKATGLCHTDLLVAAGGIPLPMPIVLGHEGVGEVEEVGSGSLTAIKKGDMVMLSFNSCGNCSQCLDGHPANCLEFIRRNWSGVRPDGSPHTFFCNHKATENGTHESEAPKVAEAAPEASKAHAETGTETETVIREADASKPSETAVEEATASKPAEGVESSASKPTDAAAEASVADRPLNANFFGQSSFSKRAIVDIRSCVRVPDSIMQAVAEKKIRLSEIAPFGCGFGTGAGTVLNSCQPRAGSSIGVYGAGAVGLASIAAAGFLSPATTVVAIDIVPERLEIAKRLGATHCVNSRDAVAAAAAIKEATGGVGLDFAIDTTGNGKVIKAMLEALGCNGVGLQVAGTPPTVIVDLNPQFLLNMGISWKGVVEGDSNPPLFLPAMLEHMKSGRFPVGELVKEYRWDELDLAIQAVKNGSVIKPVLIWD